MVDTGEGDTPSPQVEVKTSPEINIQQPAEMQEEVEEEQEMGEVDHDPTRSEGEIVFKLKNFTKISNKMLSHAVYIRDLPW